MIAFGCVWHRELPGDRLTPNEVRISTAIVCIYRRGVVLAIAVHSFHYSVSKHHPKRKRKRSDVALGKVPCQADAFKTM